MSRPRQEHLYIEERFRVAKYSTKIVAGELNRNPPNPIRQLINFRMIRYNILGQTWYFILIFIVIYYIFQTGYQFDAYCSFVPEDHRTICDEWLTNKFTHLEEFEVL